MGRAFIEAEDPGRGRRASYLEPLRAALRRLTVGSGASIAAVRLSQSDVLWKSGELCRSGRDRMAVAELACLVPGVDVVSDRTRCELAD